MVFLKPVINTFNLLLHLSHFFGMENLLVMICSVILFCWSYCYCYSTSCCKCCLTCNIICGEKIISAMDKDIFYLDFFVRMSMFSCQLFFFRSTAELENLENLILMYASKRIAYRPPTYRSRNLLAAIDHNKHINRPSIVNRDGTLRYCLAKNFFKLWIVIF